MVLASLKWIAMIADCWIDCRKLTAVALCLIAWGVVETNAYGEHRLKTPEPAAEEPNYIMPYMTVILCVALGMMAACRSSGRQDKTRLEGEFAGFTAEELKAAQAGPGKRGPAPMMRRGPELAPQAQQALKMGILSIILPLAGLAVGPFAVWRSLNALKLIRMSPNLKGEQLAIAGIITGGVGALIGLIWLIVVIVLVSGGSSHSQDDATDALWRHTSPPAVTRQA